MSYAFSRDISKIFEVRKPLSQGWLSPSVAVKLPCDPICPFHPGRTMVSAVSPILRLAQILYDVVYLAEVIFRYEIERHIGNPGTFYRIG